METGKHFQLKWFDTAESKWKRCCDLFANNCKLKAEIKVWPE